MTNRGRVHSVWWLVLWRETAISLPMQWLVVPAILGGLSGLEIINPMSSDDPFDAPQIVAALLLGGTTAILIRMLVVRMALRKRYREFRIAVVGEDVAEIFE